jgi:hypothetical protein
VLTTIPGGIWMIADEVEDEMEPTCAMVAALPPAWSK